MKKRHPKMISQLFFVASITLLCLLTIWRLTTWESPDLNHSGDTSIHTCIHSDAGKLHFTLDAGGGNNFAVSLVENSKQNCVNPYFPSIHISASSSHNAWIHIVYTDSQAPQWRTFIDAENIASPGSAYPFYAYAQDFYDAPLWTYSLFNHPLSFWKGHAFAVEVDHQKKSMHCIGGIAWGFTLSHFKLRPQAMHPQLLNESDWDKAWQLLQAKLPGYSTTYSPVIAPQQNATRASDGKR